VTRGLQILQFLFIFKINFKVFHYKTSFSGTTSLIKYKTIIPKPILFLNINICYRFYYETIFQELFVFLMSVSKMFLKLF